MSIFSEGGLINALYMLVPIVLALSVHEFSHALAADLLGDPTAKMMGRLTLDPIQHIDPIGFIALFLFGFGWAKPVPFNPDNLKNRKLGTIIISVAGPLSNLLMAVAFSLLLKYVITPMNNDILSIIFTYGVVINVSLMAFNLLPLPPLDGSRILTAVLPANAEMWVYEHEQYINLVIIILLITGGVSTILSPLVSPLLSILL